MCAACVSNALTPTASASWGSNCAQGTCCQPCPSWSASASRARARACWAAPAPPGPRASRRSDRTRSATALTHAMAAGTQVRRRLPIMGPGPAALLGAVRLPSIPMSQVRFTRNCERRWCYPSTGIWSRGEWRWYRGRKPKPSIKPDPWDERSPLGVPVLQQSGQTAPPRPPCPPT